VSLSESKLKPLLDENSVHLDGRGVDERSSLGQPTQPWYDKLGSVPLSQPTGGNRLTDDFYRSWGIFHDVHKDGLAGQTGRNTLQNPFTVDLHQAIRKSFDIFKVTPEEADAIASAAAKDESPVTLSVVKNYGGTRPDRTLASGGRNRDPRTTGTPQWSRNSPNSSSPQPPASQRGRVRAWFLDRLKRGLPIPGLEDIQGK
jgi:hypothetical protein